MSKRVLASLAAVVVAAMLVIAPGAQARRRTALSIAAARGAILRFARNPGAPAARVHACRRLSVGRVACAVSFVDVSGPATVDGSPIVGSFTFQMTARRLPDGRVRLRCRWLAVPAVH